MCFPLVLVPFIPRTPTCSRRMPLPSSFIAPEHTASQHHTRIVPPNGGNSLRPRTGLYTWPSAQVLEQTLVLSLAPASLASRVRPDPGRCARHGLNIGLSFRVPVFSAIANHVGLPGYLSARGALSAHAASASFVSVPQTDARSQSPLLRTARGWLICAATCCSPPAPLTEEVGALSSHKYVQTSEIESVLVPPWTRIGSRGDRTRTLSVHDNVVR
ncbi:hypothetical protein C8Q80DRAFT_38779 [Daedaleopsis nitida]|nr:hypothetical protein C8Q80DRAFT_38779 [Daedaleopsis nitida]